jgi:hypothetical protein
MLAPQQTPAGAPPSYSADSLVRMARFPDGLSLSAKWLLETHLAQPREVRFVADLQRWLLSQIVIAMHFEHRLDPASPAISHSNVVRRLAATGIASRNTIHTFLMEMRRYQIIAPLQSPDRRQQTMQATETTEHLIRRYFDIHLRALDVIDHGQRYIWSCQHPELLQHAHPRFARCLLADPAWHQPPAIIVNFVRSDSGSSILHDLISGVVEQPADMISHIWIGKVSPSMFAKRYGISRTHIARLFREAREAGHLGWAKDSNRGDCWVSPKLVWAYRFWQAAKFAAVSQAFHEACLEIGLAEGAPAIAPFRGHIPRPTTAMHPIAP